MGPGGPTHSCIDGVSYLVRAGGGSELQPCVKQCLLTVLWFLQMKVRAGRGLVLLTEAAFVTTWSFWVSVRGRKQRFTPK